MYFGGVSDAQMRVRCSIGMHERKKQNENKNIWGSTPAAVISSTASFIFDQMLQSMSSDCYKVTISSITYEVLFSYDNSYYTHCYHQTVKEYKSNGSLIRSKTDYYQAIGG